MNRGAHGRVGRDFSGRLATVETDAALVIFCKRPRLNQGKRRLAASIGPEPAYQVARLLLKCALEDAYRWPGPVVLTVSKRQDLEWADAVFAGECRVMSQGVGSLGQRLNRVDARLRDAGHRKLVFVGTDAPILGDGYYEQALDALGHSDVVLSRADDGGVTMMANARPWPDLSALPWSTDALGASLRSQCEGHGYTVADIQGSYDVDVAADLDRLRVDLQDDARAERRRLLTVVESVNTLMTGGAYLA